MIDSVRHYLQGLKKVRQLLKHPALFDSRLSSADFIGAYEFASQKWAPRGVNDGRRVLFVTSNGAGLGHLTRVNAVAKRLDQRNFIYTMSSAHHKIANEAGQILYFPSYGDLGMSSKAWNPIMEKHFEAVVAGFKPDRIVFDGTYLYLGIRNVSQTLDIPLIWLRRGCWKVQVARNSRQWRDPLRYCEGVLVPGDFGCDESAQFEKLGGHKVLSPIIALDPDELYSARAAKVELGLPTDKNLFLVQVGAGVINDVKDLQRQAVEEILALGPEWEAVVVRNPLNPLNSRARDRVHSIDAYPVAKFFRAFQAGIFAAGYNSVQESVALRLPGIFVPNLAAKTDDQLRRAQGITHKRLGLLAEDGHELRTAIRRMAQTSVREDIISEMSKAGSADGAAEAAAHLACGRIPMND